jgi:hypothetical protein
MKAKLLLLLILVIVGAQNFVPLQAADSLDLEVVWQKEVFPKNISDAKFSVDGKWIYAAIENKIEKLSSVSGEFISIFDNVDSAFIYQITSLNISKSGNYIVGTNGNGAVVVYDTRTEKKIKQLQLGTSCVDITIDDKYLLIFSARDESYGVIVYNMQTDQQEKLLKMDNSQNVIKVSHDGRYFAVGGYYTDKNDNKTYDQVTLWDAGTWKCIDTIENLRGSGVGYRHIKFSNDDKYLGVVRGDPNDGRIYDLNNKILITTSTIGEMCLNIEFLSGYFLLICDGGSYFELRNKEQIIKKYQNHSSIMTNYNSNDKWNIFLGAGPFPITFLTQKTTGIENPIIDDDIIHIFVQNNNIVLELQNIKEKNIAIEIYDLQGRIIYQDTINILSPNNKLLLNINLFTGFYICKVKSGIKEFSQKIEIVR